MLDGAGVAAWGVEGTYGGVGALAQLFELLERAGVPLSVHVGGGRLWCDKRGCRGVKVEGESGEAGVGQVRRFGDKGGGGLTKMRGVIVVSR